MNRKIALVTGASKGIGSAIALQLAKDGYDIILHYNKSIDDARRVKMRILKTGVSCKIISADLTKSSQVNLLFKDIKKNFKKIDLVVNNAGFDHGHNFENYKLNEIDSVLKIILLSKIWITKYALPLLKKSQKASIINISSRMGKEKTIYGVSIYGAAQAGVIKFTQCCALELARYNIRVNCIAPGLAKTELNLRLFSSQYGDNAESKWLEAANSNPSKRVGMPQDIAYVASFLASEKSDYINGETIGVNGGSNLG